MVNQILLYLGAFFSFVWGVAHLFPTKSVVQGFGEISQDNKRIIAMEWIFEGVSLIFIGLLVAAVTLVDRGSTASRVVYWVCFAELNGRNLRGPGRRIFSDTVTNSYNNRLRTASSLAQPTGKWTNGFAYGLPR